MEGVITQVLLEGVITQVLLEGVITQATETRQLSNLKNTH